MIISLLVNIKIIAKINVRWINIIFKGVWYLEGVVKPLYSVCYYILLVYELPALGLESPKLNVDVNTPKGKAPIPKDKWKPSPKLNPGNTLLFSASVLCPAGRGGTCSEYGFNLQFIIKICCLFLVFMKNVFQ